MGAQYHNGHWYGGGQNIDIQSDPTATSFDPNKVPTGATAQSVLNSNLGKNDLAVAVNITSYTINNKYTIPADGYIAINSGTVVIKGSSDTDRYIAVASPEDGQKWASIFVKKGMKAYCQGTLSICRYFALE